MQDVPEQAEFKVDDIRSEVVCSLVAKALFVNLLQDGMPCRVHDFAEASLERIGIAVHQP